MADSKMGERSRFSQIGVDEQRSDRGKRCELAPDRPRKRKAVRAEGAADDAGKHAPGARFGNERERGNAIGAVLRSSALGPTEFRATDVSVVALCWVKYVAPRRCEHVRQVTRRGVQWVGGLH